MFSSHNRTLLRLSSSVVAHGSFATLLMLLNSYPIMDDRSQAPPESPAWYDMAWYSPLTVPLESSIVHRLDHPGADQHELRSPPPLTVSASVGSARRDGTALPRL